MAPDGFQQAVRGEWHVTVVAGTSRRFRRMMRVLSELVHISEALVALQTGTVTVHAELELIVGPIWPRPRIVARLVHLVARQARHLAALETRRVEQAIVFSPAGTDHSVGPETAGGGRVGTVHGPVRHEIESAADDEVNGVRTQVLSGTVTKAMPQPLLQRLVTARRDDAVTLTAPPRCTVVGQPGRIDNAGISLAGKPLSVTV